MDLKSHWETIYSNKTPEQVSWTQKTPQPSLELIENCDLNKDAKIIDIGGGDSLLVDHLLKLGYTDITVLDISKEAIGRAKKRLGTLQNRVQWIVSNIIDFQPTESYDCWHDRASFHFLTDESDINQYISIVNNHIAADGYLIVGTFSEDGPKKCSGIPITQYTEESLSERFASQFKKEQCLRHDHQTPFDTIQNFVFCKFKKT